jgi:membrane protein involved in colicin uptake
MEQPPHLTHEDVEALRQSIEAGKLPVKFNSPFDAVERQNARQTAEARAQQEADARQTAEARAQQEAEARQTAEAELAQALAELERLRARTTH